MSDLKERRQITFTLTSFVLIWALVFPSVRAQVGVRGPPQAEQKELKKIGRIGETVKLICPVSGFPAPMVEWSKNGDIIDFMWDRHKTGRKSLKIKHVTEDDTGIFTCKGINGFGSEEVRIELIIVDPGQLPRGMNNLEKSDVAPPVFTQETKSSQRRYSKTIGDTFKVTCEALGSPEPEIFWFKDGQHIDESVHYQRGRSAVEFSIMGSADAGVYSCRARNMFGEQRKNYTLEVKQPSGTMHAIVTEASPANSTVLEGETATLQCRVKSLNSPHLKWLKKLDLHEITEENILRVGHERYRILSTNQDVPTGNDEYLNKLVLKNTQPSDSGMYICFVTNSGFGALTYKSMNLRVLERSMVHLGDNTININSGMDEEGSQNADDPQTNTSTMILTIVISLAIIVVGLITIIGCCFFRRKHEQKETSAALSSNNTSHYSGRSDSPDVQKPFMLDNGANSLQQSKQGLVQVNSQLQHPNQKLILTTSVGNSCLEKGITKYQTQLPLPPTPPVMTNTMWNSRNHIVYPQNSSLLMINNLPQHKQAYTDSGFDNSKEYEETSAVNSGSTMIGANQYEVPYAHLIAGSESQKQYQRTQQQYFAKHFPRVSNVNAPATTTISSARSELPHQDERNTYNFRAQYHQAPTRQYLSDYESQ